MTTKCPSCGYTHEKVIKTVDKVIRYQSGKRKGEIKAVHEEDIVREVGHSEFHKMTLMLSIIPNGHGGFTPQTVDVKVCPECKTMIFDDDVSMFVEKSYLFD